MMNDHRVLPDDWDPGKAADAVLAGLITVTAPQVKGAHDADMVLVGDRAYIVAEINDVRPGESPAWPEIYCALHIVDLRSMTVERVLPVARSGQVFGNETLPEGACFVPRILQRDPQHLRCFFATQQPGKGQAQTWFIDLDLATQAFETCVHKARLKTSTGTLPMQPCHLYADAVAHGLNRPPQDHGLYLFDVKTFDGRVYVALNNFPGRQNALAVANDALDTFEVVGHYFEPQAHELSESAVNRLPDGTWMAICRQEGGDRNYCFATSQDGVSWTVGEQRAWVDDGTNSKPTFDCFGGSRRGGLYYLGWQAATRVHDVPRSVFNLDVSPDGLCWERKYRFETDRSFQYPTFRAHRGAIYLAVTRGDPGVGGKVCIQFGRLEEGVGPE